MQSLPGNTPLSPLRSLSLVAARHPIALFLALAFGFAYPLMGLVILVRDGVIPGAGVPERFGIDLEEAAGLLMTILGLLPATILVTMLEGGRPALVTLLRRAGTWRVGLAWWLVITLALPGTTVLLALLLGDRLRMPSAGVLINEVVGVAVAFLLVNLWEEMAWSGFLQTRLERSHSFLVAAFLTAIPFGAIHLPLKTVNGTTSAGELAQALVLYVVLGLIVRPLFGIIMRGTGDSVFAAALMHTMFNRSNNVDGIAADLLAGPNRSLAALIATLLLTIAIGLVIRPKLTRAYRLKLDTRRGDDSGAADLPLHCKPA
jgi:membrane protease YdiL (CAAX protease family)